MEVERERAKERLKTFRECVSKSDAQIGGEELKIFRESVSKRDAFSAGRGHTLTLWTEEGALFHAKMLNTRPAWLIYKMLVANYFDPFAKKLYRQASRKARQASIEWQIARWCKVGHKFVGKIRKDLTGDIPSEKQRTYITKHGKPAQMNTANIGKPKVEVELCYNQGIEK